MSRLYIPQKKIAIASSFEGVVNNGARECALVAFNAYHRMVDQKKIRGYKFMPIMEPEKFNSKETGNNSIIQAFLKLRPLVRDAEDYLTVIQLITKYLQHLPVLVSGNYSEDFALMFFADNFNRVKNAAGPERTEFGEEFYAERKRMQDESYEKWLSTQAPFEESIEQFRILAQLKVMNGELRAVNGFELYYVTSKDEATTYQLCALYGKIGSLEPNEVMETIKKPEGMSWADLLSQLKSCIIRKDHIIGLESAPKANKLAQMEIIMEKEGIPASQVWRVNDRYDQEEARLLKSAGFEYFVVTGGYAFPWDYKKAAEDGVVVIERDKFAETLCSIAKEKGI